jgi:hypothetical protein
MENIKTTERLTTPVSDEAFYAKPLALFCFSASWQQATTDPDMNGNREDCSDADHPDHEPKEEP